MSRVLSLYKRLKSDFLSKIIETFLTRILLILLGLVNTIIITRALGPEGRGMLAVALTIGAVGIQFGNLGFHISNTYYVSQNKRLLPNLVANTILISIVVGGFICFVTWCYFYMNPSFVPLHGWLLFSSLIGIPIGLAYLLLQNILIGIHEVRPFNMIELINKSIVILLTILVFMLHQISVLMIMVCSLIPLVLSVFLVLKKINKHLNSKIIPSYVIFKEHFHYGFKAYVGAFFAFMIIKSDILLVQHYLGEEETGFYSISSTLADMVYMIPTIVGSLLFPKLSALTNNEEKWRLTKKLTFIITGVMIVVVGVSILLAKPMISLLFGETFLPAYVPFCILSVAMLFYGINNVISVYFSSIGLPWFAVYIWIIVFLMNVILNIIMIPIWGIVGSAASSLICYAAIMVFQYLYVILKRVKGETYESKKGF